MAGLDEWQLVELRNHSILAIMRNCANATGSLRSCQMLDDDSTAGQHGGRRVAVAVSTVRKARVPTPPTACTSLTNPIQWVCLSQDGGVSFSKPWLHPDLVTPICNAAVINYGSEILFSGPGALRMNVSHVSNE